VNISHIYVRWQLYLVLKKHWRALLGLRLMVQMSLSSMSSQLGSSADGQTWLFVAAASSIIEQLQCLLLAARLQACSTNCLKPSGKLLYYVLGLKYNLSQASVSPTSVVENETFRAKHRCFQRGRHFLDRKADDKCPQYLQRNSHRMGVLR
jgi:hypothetical protein